MEVPGAGRPKYSILADELRSQIERGVYADGDRLPSENEMAGQYGLSRQTVRQALDLLEAEGVLSRRRGSGTYVERVQPKAPATHSIGVVTSYIGDYIFPDIIRGIEAKLAENGYRTLLFSTQNRVENERAVLESFLSHPVDGLIVEGTKSAFPNPNLALYRKLEEQGVPCVFINGAYRELSPISLVTEDRSCGYQAAGYLLRAKGRKPLGGIFKSDDRQGHERYAGFARAVIECTGELRDENIVWYTTEDYGSLFAEGAGRLLERLSGCAGVVCYNDQIAYDLIMLLRARGVDVPGQVAVIGFDDARVSLYSPVPITTFSHPKERMGTAAAEMMLRLLNGEQTVSRVMHMEFLPRASTGDR